MMSANWPPRLRRVGPLWAHGPIPTPLPATNATLGQQWARVGLFGQGRQKQAGWRENAPKTKWAAALLMRLLCEALKVPF